MGLFRLLRGGISAATFRSCQDALTKILLPLSIIIVLHFYRQLSTVPGRTEVYMRGYTCEPQLKEPSSDRYRTTNPYDHLNTP